MKAQEFLKKAANLMDERGKQYDQPEGERSMGRAVRAFNAITGHNLTEPEGWLLLLVLKNVRQWQNPDKYHGDSAEDGVAYAALMAEALSSNQSVKENSNKLVWENAPAHATHKLKAIDQENFYKWAYHDEGSECYRECSTQYKIDMTKYKIIAIK